MDWPIGDARSIPGWLSVAITAHASANTKGSWAELTAGLDYDVYGLYLPMTHAAITSNRSFLFDIGIGGSGSEVVLVPNIYHAQYNSGGAVWMPGMAGFFPCFIPKGTRIAFRCQCSTGSTAMTVIVRFAAGALRSAPPIQTWDALGVSTAASGGTAVTAGDTSMGSWTQIISTTARDYKYFAMLTNDVHIGTYSISFDIGIGGSGSEVVLATSTLIFRHTFTEITSLAVNGPCRIPKGTRIAVRAGNTFTGGTKNTQVALYGGH